MAPSAKFWDKIAKKYAKQPVADVPSYEKKLEITRGYLSPETQVLEFGCGTGSTAISHAPFVRHIRAIDHSRMGELEPRGVDLPRRRQCSSQGHSRPGRDQRVRRRDCEGHLGSLGRCLVIAGAKSDARQQSQSSRLCRVEVDRLLQEFSCLTIAPIKKRCLSVFDEL